MRFSKVLIISFGCIYFLGSSVDVFAGLGLQGNGCSQASTQNFSKAETILAKLASNHEFSTETTFKATVASIQQNPNAIDRANAYFAIACAASAQEIGELIGGINTQKYIDCATKNMQFTDSAKANKVVTSLQKALAPEINTN